MKDDGADVLLSAVKSLFRVAAEIRKHFQDTKQTLDLDDGAAARSRGAFAGFLLRIFGVLAAFE